MPPRRIPGLRWWTIGLIMLGAILNFLTRNTLSVAAPTVMASLHISAQQYSWITGAFQGAIMLQPAAGYVLDVAGLRYGMAAFALAWSLISMAHGLAFNWQTLAGLRGLLGFAEGTANPGGMKVIAEWFPARERGFAGGVYNIGASVGSMLAPPLVAAAIFYYDWQSAFVITGALGLVWAALWFWFYRPPADHPSLGTDERTLIAAGQEAHLRGDGAPPALIAIARRRNFWGIALPRLLADPTWGTLSFWVPLYLTSVRHFDLKEIAIYAWLPFLAADLGCLFGPAVVHFLQTRGVGLIDARRGAFTLGAFLMLGVVFVGFVQSPVLAVALICLAGFAHQTLSITVITMASDLFARNEVATVAGMAGTCGNFGVLVFSLLIGALVARVGYAPFFVALGLLDLVGATLLWTLVRTPGEAVSP
ncbi:MAG TPA: MFS transporter [Rhizomicrobium sp.]|jgi:ACS family hexuronate transporter-like MFS transporter|nr:MFS transporter [Rhizomicrobium sp.]